MSHLARELDRHLVWLEKQADDLGAAVRELARAVEARITGELWEDVQVNAIRLAVNDQADHCGRAILAAQTEVSEFRQALIDALEQR